ncbi:hypothetical protein Patl1_17340 [Pistacia atlantica]|uniref:Uncharacterized protein n=1 Tax=Pistacia atlantica TaxID=434234 RepID=A0ACC1C1K8_9ROSI|nr:hypothetical protein Patl1_17340 [Pistacia atlantica]
MSFTCGLISAAAPARIFSDESTKFSYSNNDTYYNVKSLDIPVMSFSRSISNAAYLRNGKRNFGTRRRFCCKSQLGVAVAELAPITSASYGVLLLGGGLFAFAKSGSKGSLFGGLTGAALMASAYFLMQSPETRAIGDALGFGSAFLFASVFGIRFAATRKLIPAGLLLGLSICSLAVFIIAYLQDRI